MPQAGSNDSKQKDLKNKVRRTLWPQSLGITSIPLITIK